jgi:hypothetical protein
MDGVALKPLTVDFHEVGFVSSLNGENGQPFYFQMSDEQRQQTGSPWGPANAQALNRYSYVQNNPLKYTDPSGHTLLYRVRIDPKDVDTFTSNLGRHQSATLYRAGASGQLLVAGAAAACGRVVIGHVCGCLAEGALGVSLAAIADDYAAFDAVIQKANRDAGEDGFISIDVEQTGRYHYRATISAYDKNGKLVSQHVYKNLPEYLASGIEYSAAESGVALIPGSMLGK